jgi:hypothetical protein
VEAEQVGEDGGGELAGEAEQCGAAAGLGVDTDGAQADAELGWGDRPSGQVAGEQPGGGGRGSDAAVAAAFGDELACGGGERTGQGRVVAAEPRAISSATSRPATGGAPMRRAAGSADSATASWRSACPDGATAMTAASITRLGSDPSAAAAMSVTCSRRQRRQFRS